MAAEKKRLAKEEALAAAKRLPPCTPEVEIAGDSTCSFSQAQYATQVAKVAQQFQSKEYKNQWGLATIRADIGYANVRLLEGKDAKPGAGVKVGVVDTDIALKHPAFAGQNILVQVTEVFAGSGRNKPKTLLAPNGLSSHGTAVASVIVAGPDAWDKDGKSFPGIAWGADLTMFAIGTETGVRKARRFWDVDDGKAAQEYRGILAQVSILNISATEGGLIDDYTKEQIFNTYRERLEAWTQADRAEKTIIVWGAGNDNGQECLRYIERIETRSFHRCKASDPEADTGKLRADAVGLMAGTPLHFPELRGHTISVVAVDKSGKIASFSNRCGTAADWCISAPGQEVSVAHYEVELDVKIDHNGPLDSDGQFHFTIKRVPLMIVDSLAKGTAFAAPMVTGSLAVMKGLFGDQLSNTDLVVRLFATANKTGRYTDKKVYGQGLLDLGAATSPVGEPVIVVVGSIVGGGVPLAMTSLASGKAFGDSLLRSVAGEGVVTFDALGAPFSYDLESFVGYAKSSSLQERLQTLMDSEDVLEEFEDPAYGLSAPVMTTGRRFFPGGRVSRTRNGREASGDVSSGVSFGRVADKGHLSVAKGALMVSWEDGEGGLSATAFGTTQPSSTAAMRGYTTTPTGYPAGHADKPHTSGGVVAWQPSGAPIGLRAGWMTEQGSVLGASGRGAFGSLTGQTGFVGLHTGWKTDTWSMHANAEFGTIASTPEKSLIKDISGVITSTFGLSATRSFGAGRALQVSLSQPLRVESGRASFVVPVARTKSGSVVRRSFTSGLSPSGRQIDFSLSWHHRVSESSRVHLSGILTHNPGHRANAKPEAALLLGWKHSF